MVEGSPHMWIKCTDIYPKLHISHIFYECFRFLVDLRESCTLTVHRSHMLNNIP